MARTTRAQRRFRRGKRELIWSSVVFNGAVFGDETLSQALVISTDWVRSNNFEKGAVLLGIRGWYQVTPVLSSGTPNPDYFNHFMSIVLTEADEIQVLNWYTAGPYNGEDILFTDGGAFSGGGSEAGVVTWANSPNLSRQLEVKAKRKLNSDSLVAVNFQTDADSKSHFVSGVFRSLIQLP